MTSVCSTHTQFINDILNPSSSWSSSSSFTWYYTLQNYLFHTIMAFYVSKVMKSPFLLYSVTNSLVYPVVAKWTYFFSSLPRIFSVFFCSTCTQRHRLIFLHPYQ